MERKFSSPTGTQHAALESCQARGPIVGLTSRVTDFMGLEVAVTPLTAKALAACARHKADMRNGILHRVRNLTALVDVQSRSATVRATKVAGIARNAASAAAEAAEHLRRYGWRDLARKVEAQGRRAA